MPRKALVCYMVDMFLFLAGLFCALSGFVFMAEGEGGYRGGRNPGFSSVYLGERARGFGNRRHRRCYRTPLASLALGSPDDEGSGQAQGFKGPSLSS